MSDPIEDAIENMISKLEETGHNAAAKQLKEAAMILNDCPDEWSALTSALGSKAVELISPGNPELNGLQHMAKGLASVSLMSAIVGKG